MTYRKLIKQIGTVRVYACVGYGGVVWVEVRDKDVCHEHTPSNARLTAEAMQAAADKAEAWQ